MKSHIANTIDLEMDRGAVIEIGLTTIDLNRRQILQSYSYPINNDFGIPITEEVYKLTGWTEAKLKRQGEPLLRAFNRLLDKHGLRGRLLITDSSKELTTLLDCAFCEDAGEWIFRGVFPPQINVSDLFAIKHKAFGKEYSLEHMLEVEGMEFEGRQHRAKDDSFNIARLFLSLTNGPYTGVFS